jgi:hypothetical protein
MRPFSPHVLGLYAALALIASYFRGAGGQSQKSTHEKPRTGLSPCRANRGSSCTPHAPHQAFEWRRGWGLGVTRRVCERIDWRMRTLALAPWILLRLIAKTGSRHLRQSSRW